MIGKGVLAFGALSRPCSCLERIVSFYYNEGEGLHGSLAP